MDDESTSIGVVVVVVVVVVVPEGYRFNNLGESGGAPADLVSTTIMGSSSWNSLRFASLTDPRAGRISPPDSWSRSLAVAARVGEDQAIVAAASEGEYLCAGGFAGLMLPLPLDLLGARKFPFW